MAEILDLYEQDYDQYLLKERVEMASDKVLSDLFYYLSEADNGLPQILKTNYKLCNSLLIIIMKKQLANFQIDPDLEVKADFQIDPAWEDFGRLTEKADFQIDPAWEDFGSLTDEQRLEEQRLEEQRLEEQRLEEQRLEEQRLEEQRIAKQRLEEQRLEEQRLEEQRIAEQTYVWKQRDELSKINDVFRGRFLLPFKEENDKIQEVHLASTIAPLIVSEIKKEFKDEILAFTDYTYSKQFYTEPYQPEKRYYMKLNYLNLITNKGNIYSVQFCVDKANVSQCFSYYNMDKYHFDIKLVKYDETINTTENNWILANMYTKTHNGIEEELEFYNPSKKRQHVVWNDGKIKDVFTGNGILTIISELS